MQREIVRLLSDKVATLPVDQLRQFVGWTQDLEVDKSVWTTIAAGLRSAGKPRLARTESTPLARCWPGFWRAKAVKGSICSSSACKSSRARSFSADYAVTLLDVLSGGRWSAENEDEALRLLPQLSSTGSIRRARHASGALQKLTDAMVAALSDADGSSCRPGQTHTH